MGFSGCFLKNVSIQFVVWIKLAMTHLIFLGTAIADYD
jgi:hypothetical protein